MENSVKEQIYHVLDKLGAQILAVYKAQVPKKTGALLNSIRYKIVERGDSYSLGFYYLKYGVWVNLGTYERKDTSAYGLNDFDLPAYNARPQKSVKLGIAPRYWTSLKGRKAEIMSDIEEEVQGILGVTADDIMKMFEGTQTEINI